MAREEGTDRRGVPGKLFGPDGCSEPARGEAVPAPGFTTKQGRCGCDPAAKGRMAQATSSGKQRSGTHPDAVQVKFQQQGRMPHRIGAGWFGLGVVSLGMGDGLPKPSVVQGNLPAAVKGGTRDLAQQPSWASWALRDRKSVV